jgi:hypothetical protein
LITTAMDRWTDLTKRYSLVGIAFDAFNSFNSH